MYCDKNDYAPEGKPMYKIVEEFADDRAVWAQDFLDAWDQMTRNGAESLKASPQEGWLGHYSLRGKFNKNVYSVFEDCLIG